MEVFIVLILLKFQSYCMCDKFYFLLLSFKCYKFILNYSHLNNILNRSELCLNIDDYN